MSPNSTLGGDLNKKWKCVGGTRVLLKAGTGLVQQEVMNELIATKLCDRILEEGEYVPYRVLHEGGRIFSACDNMLHEDEELITALDVIKNKRKPNTMNDYQFLVRCYKDLGLKDVELTLEKMFTCDYILANRDRHWQNFGVIRNVETLEYTRIAPIFDSGTSLWCRDFDLDYTTSYTAKPFNRGMTPDRQLALFDDFSWLDLSKLDGFVDEARRILSENQNIPLIRIGMVTKKLEMNIEKLNARVEKVRAERERQSQSLESRMGRSKDTNTSERTQNRDTRLGSHILYTTRKRRTFALLFLVYSFAAKTSVLSLANLE